MVVSKLEATKLMEQVVEQLQARGYSCKLYMHDYADLHIYKDGIPVTLEQHTISRVKQICQKIKGVSVYNAHPNNHTLRFAFDINGKYGIHPIG